MTTSVMSKKETLDTEQLRKIDAYWRAANYLSVGQIYLLDNPSIETTTQKRTCETPATRSLGYDTRPELHLCPL